VTRIKKY